MSRCAVLGLGNPLLSDDAVGLRVADELSRLLAADPIPGVDVLQSARGGFELIDLLQGYERAVIIDALDIPEGEPGRVRRLGMDEFAGSARLVGAHEVSLSTAFGLARRLSIPMPSEVEVIGIEVEDSRTFSEQLTPAVNAVVAPLAAEIHATLKSLR